MGAIEEFPAVRLELESTPECPSLVRGALSAVGEEVALDSRLLDDIKTAATEACNNVVTHAYRGLPGPLSVCTYLEPSSLEVVVRDYGLGISDDLVDDDQERGVGLPIIEALTREATFRRCDDGGTEVRMQFAVPAAGQALVPRPAAAAPDDEWISRVSGDAVASISPLCLLEGVLGRLARALAARARFSLDRFSDVYLATDVIARHAVNAATGARIAFGLSIQTRHLEMTIGPFRRGASAVLSHHAPISAAESTLGLLADELEIVSANGSEMLRVVIDEPPPRAATAE
ncbi:MAG: ATP-binding protein [Solirubrobacteraceae bacterium]